MVPNAISGIVSSVDLLENVTDQVSKMSGQSDMGTILLPDLYGFVRIRFQINRFLFSEEYAIGQGTTNYIV